MIKYNNLIVLFKKFHINNNNKYVYYHHLMINVKIVLIALFLLIKEYIYVGCVLIHDNKYYYFIYDIFNL